MTLKIAESLPKIVVVFEFKKNMKVPSGVIIRVNEDGYHEVWNGLHKSWIKIKAGDMIRYDLQPNNVYPIDREVFDKTYRIIEE